MALLKDIFIKKPKRSNFDLSRRLNMTMAPGPGYITLCDEVLPGDSWAIRQVQDIRTYPLLAPLFNSFTIQNAYFFVPSRLYCQQMDINQRKFFKGECPFPTFEAPYVSTPGGSRALSVKKSSLLELLGLPANFLYVRRNESDTTTPLLNAVPLLGYYDIFRNYYANSQENEFYLISASQPGGSPEAPRDTMLARFDLDSLDDFFYEMIKAPGQDFTTVWTQQVVDSDGDAATSPLLFSRTTPLGGLWLRTHKSDMFTAWLNQATYNDMVNSSRINVENGSITVNQIRFGSSLMRYYEKGILSNGRYDDWVEVQYGVKCDQNLCIPELLGVISSSIVFDEVIATADTGQGTNGSVGDLGGKGYGQTVGKPIRFSASEHGYIMCITSIIPNVMYSQGVSPYLFRTDLEQVYAPDFDRIGFQPLPLEYLYSVTPPIGLYSPEWKSLGIGYQAAYQELMTATDRSIGDLGVGGDLEYWNIVRDFAADFDPEGQSTVIPNTTSYINPDQYSYAFANQSLTAENFIVQNRFDVWVRRCKGKQITPKLS